MTSPAGDLPEADPSFLAYAAHELHGSHDHHGRTNTAAPEPARTIGDPQLIERLVANLVANAIRHNRPGGRLDVRAIANARDATVSAQARASGGGLTIEVGFPRKAYRL